jgi:hypothetical protein
MNNNIWQIIAAIYEVSIWPAAVIISVSMVCRAVRSLAVIQIRNTVTKP